MQTSVKVWVFRIGSIIGRSGGIGQRKPPCAFRDVVQMSSGWSLRVFMPSAGARNGGGADELWQGSRSQRCA